MQQIRLVLCTLVSLIAQQMIRRQFRFSFVLACNINISLGCGRSRRLKLSRARLRVRYECIIRLWSELPTRTERCILELSSVIHRISTI